MQLFLSEFEINFMNLIRNQHCLWQQTKEKDMKRILFIACIVIAIHVLFIGCGSKYVLVRHNSLMSHELTNNFLSVISDYEDLKMNNSFLDSAIMNRPEVRKEIKSDINSPSNWTPYYRGGGFFYGPNYFNLKNEFTIRHSNTIVTSIHYSGHNNHLPAKFA